MMSDSVLATTDRHRLRASTKQGSVATSSILVRFLCLVLLLGGLVDIPASFDIGPISLLGILTVLYALLAWSGWLTHPLVTRSTILALWPFVMFMGWGLFSSIWHVPTKEGFQNLAVIVAFVGLILLASRQSRRSPRFPQLLEKALSRATWMAVVLFGARLLALDQRLGFSSVGNRTFALFALFGVAYHLARWRYGLRTGLCCALVVALTIVVSLSRVATVVALFLIILSQLSRTSLVRWVRMGLVAALTLGGLYLAVIYVAPLRARFFEGDKAIQIGDLTLNTMGRAKFWRAVLDSYVESPWFGKGAGSSQALITSQYSRWANHPHNDHLRVLHDYGSIGFALWIFGFGRLALTIWRAWMKNDRKHPIEARLHMTAFLCLVAMILAMITDNAVVYAFLMAPFGVIIGASLGRVSLDQ